MKQGKFAPITAALLARKGEARPWEYSGANDTAPRDLRLAPAPEPITFVQTPRQERADSPPPSFTPAFASVSQPKDETRKMTMRLSQADYERVGIIATKRDTTRQRLLHQMLDQFLAAAACEFGPECGCIGGAPCRRHD